MSVQYQPAVCSTQ